MFSSPTSSQPPPVNTQNMKDVRDDVGVEDDDEDDVKDEDGDNGPVKDFLKHSTLTFSKAFVVVLSYFPFWSRSFPLTLDTLVVPVRSDQDNKVETCLLNKPFH